MKSGGTMRGGSLNTQYINTSELFDYTPYMDAQLTIIAVANYLLKSVQAFSNKGIPIYAISIQVRSLRSTHSLV
jgi:hypothetical protein